MSEIRTVPGGMRLGVLCNGEVENYAWLREVADSLDGVVCADGGGNHAFRMGIKPLCVIGDLDSIEPEALRHFGELEVPVKRFPCEKDETDLQLALDEALELGAAEVVLLAATGRRLDHTLGNISVLAELLLKGIPGLIIDEYNEIRVCQKEAVIHGEIGEEVSLLPLTTTVTGVSSANLKYGLKDGEFSLGNPYGISNMLTSTCARVTFDQGLLLVIKARDRCRKATL